MEGLTGWTEVEGLTGWTGTPVEDTPDLNKYTFAKYWSFQTLLVFAKKKKPELE